MSVLQHRVKELLRPPYRFFRDPIVRRWRRLAIRRELRDQTHARPTYVVGFSTWKEYLRKYFPDRRLILLPREITEAEFHSTYKAPILSHPHAEIFIWGFKAPAFIFDFIAKHGVKVMFVEDGFVRSAGLGATKEPPRSLCMDSRTPYFNAREASDLETLLNTCDFSVHPGLLDRADAAIDLILKTGVSKYNHARPVSVTRAYGPKNSERVLVLGQVEDDASILFGCSTPLTNNDAVRLAAQEHPDAQIIYKPHPDVLQGHRPNQSNPDDVRHLCLILQEDMPLAQALETIDHVYTITSLGGFEALLRGLKVTTLGAPFYSGWGLTGDRQAIERRTRRLTVREVFAAAYLLYPSYFDPDTGHQVELEDVVSRLSSRQSLAAGGEAGT